MRRLERAARQRGGRPAGSCGAGRARHDILDIGEPGLREGRQRHRLPRDRRMARPTTRPDRGDRDAAIAELLGCCAVTHRVALSVRENRAACRRSIGDTPVCHRVRATDPSLHRTKQARGSSQRHGWCGGRSDVPARSSYHPGSSGRRDVARRAARDAARIMRSPHPHALLQISRRLPRARLSVSSDRPCAPYDGAACTFESAPAWGVGGDVLDKMLA